MRQRGQHLVGGIRIENDGTLIERLVHRRAEAGHEVHLLAELRRMRDHLDRGCFTIAESEAHPRTFRAQRQTGNGRHCGRLEAFVIESAAEQLQSSARSIEQATLGLAASLAKPLANPSGAPLQLPERLPTILGAATSQRDRNHALHFRFEQDGHSNMRRAGGVA